MKIRRLSKEENDIISTCIANIIANQKNNTEAIFINSYRVDEIDYIDVQFVNNSISSVQYETINCPIINIIIRSVDIPAIDFSYGLNHYRERYNAKRLLNGQIIMDTNNEFYKSLAKEAYEFGFGEYSNNVTFEPPLKVKKLK